ncbi:MAG TPA: hypothetical protein VF469_41965 [Kofleriaceae bacterium]
MLDAAVDAPPDAPPPHVVRGNITDQDTGAPIVGGRTCILDHPEIACGTTDITGSYTMALPQSLQGVDFAESFTAAGYLGAVHLAGAGSFPGIILTGTALMSDASAAKLLQQQAGFSYPAIDRGFVLLSVFFATGGAVVGASVAATPSPDVAPVYFDTSGPNLTLTATTTDGYLLLGGLPPGRIDISISGATCAPFEHSFDGWEPAAPYAIAGEVAAGSLTKIFAVCH